MREHLREIVAYIHRAGGTNVHVAHGGKHKRVTFQWGGRDWLFITSCTPADNYFAAVQAVADIRRMLGLSRHGKRIGTRRAGRGQTSARGRATPPALTTLPDWRDRLAFHAHAREVRRIRLDRAWHALWRDAMVAVGGRSLLRVPE